ncbi:MAG: chemotaxis-specific protein-glutamate methyltransferase CheB [Polyangiales bacterium]
MGAIKVLIVDDSALARSLVTRALKSDPGIEVVGAASDAYEARDLLVRLRPDVLTLDFAMPRMDGVTFMKKFMSVIPTPTVVLTGNPEEVRGPAMEAGAFAVIGKPKAAVEGAESKALIDAVRAAATPRRSVAPVAGGAGPSLIAIGASTGGVQALSQILPRFPADSPPVLIVQHMPEGVTRDFSKRLDEICPTSVREVTDGERLRRGGIYVAPGGVRHTHVIRAGGEYVAKLVEGPLVTGHRPSVDAMFHSIVALGPASTVAAALLTGMGADGAQGLLALRLAGARTYAQDRATCAVWGMPAAAESLGAAQRFVALDEVPTVLLGAAMSLPRLQRA